MEERTEKMILKDFATKDGISFIKTASELGHQVMFLLDEYCADLDKVVANVIVQEGLNPEKFEICPDSDEGGIDVLQALTELSVNMDTGKEIPVMRYMAEIENTKYVVTATAKGSVDDENDAVSMDTRIIMMADNGRSKMINDGTGWKPALY